MSNTEILLALIGFMLVVIWMYVRWIYLKVEYGKVFDPQAPVNVYGEGLVDGIQNAIERGQRGISTHG
ncbi:hypothetical protein ACRQ5Q_22605 [Bradyrhizobium sp. PMVTL-01]|uniref:hypothetical protein n=1 Tax=Bradyrhizobium sp. PMVTL-01 TaxID=3434999 RepID=UPI003F7024DD